MSQSSKSRSFQTSAVQNAKSSTFSSSDSFSTYISTFAQLDSREDKGSSLKIFTADLQSAPWYLEDQIDEHDIPCSIICFTMQGGIAEPSQGSCIFFSGSLGDLPNGEGLKVTVSFINEFPGDPHTEEFATQVAPPSCACIFSVGRVVPQPKGTMVLPPGWKCFDIATRYYNSDKKEKMVYNIRWVFESKKRWDNMVIPECGAVVQLQGRLIGRAIDTLSCNGIIICLIDNIDILSRGSSNSFKPLQNKRKASQEASTISPTPWKMRGAKVLSPITPIQPRNQSSKLNKPTNRKKSSATVIPVSSSADSDDESSDSIIIPASSVLRSRLKAQPKPTEIPSDKENTQSEDELLA